MKLACKTANTLAIVVDNQIPAAVPESSFLSTITLEKQSIWITRRQLTFADKNSFHFRSRESRRNVDTVKRWQSLRTTIMRLWARNHNETSILFPDVARKEFRFVRWNYWFQTIRATILRNDLPQKISSLSTSLTRSRYHFRRREFNETRLRRLSGNDKVALYFAAKLPSAFHEFSEIIRSFLL